MSKSVVPLMLVICDAIDDLTVYSFFSSIFYSNYLFSVNERKICKSSDDTSSSNEESIISYLLSRKANVNSRDKFGCTPLHYAVSKCNDIGVRELLMDKNINLEVNETTTFFNSSHAYLRAVKVFF